MQIADSETDSKVWMVGEKRERQIVFPVCDVSEALIRSGLSFYFTLA